MDNMSLDRLIIDVVLSIPQKIYEVLSSVWGVVLSSLVFCATFLGDRFPLIVYIAVAILIDAGWGVATSVKTKKFIFSKLLSKSAIKIAAYISLYALVALAEKGFTGGDFMLTSSIIASILIAAEIWSTLGHIAIHSPNFVVVKILRKYLIGEMSKKTGIPEDELLKILNDDKAGTNSISE